MPWDGYDPRSLTKAAIEFSVTASGTRRVESYELVEQLELFPEGTSYGT